MGITQWALGDKNYNTLQDLESQYAEQYPGMDTSGGVFSDARHAAATSLMSDRLGGVPVVSDILANVGGFAREVPTFTSEALGLTPFGESWEDLKANAQAFNYPSNTSAADIYADVFSKYNANKGIPETNIGYKYGQAQGAHPHMMNFKQQQFMNKKKQDMQRRIREGEKKRIEQEKIKAAQDNWKPTYNPVSSHAEAQATGGDYHGGQKSTVDGQTTDWGPMSHMIARGGLAQRAPRGSYFNGGLASSYRHGGF